ncbi:MAG: hypothetical protein PWP65_900 [Clostridia bacterium]|nr:hypothetical protein [Clostridia bacterium]
MAFDGLFLYAILQELVPWTGSRVDRIYQPQKDMLILHLRQGRETRRLLLAAGAEQARVHWAEGQYPNPSQPPLFCMVLRKHLEGARLVAFRQPRLERILELEFAVFDELGRPGERLLIAEIMGKHSNIILLDAGNNTIIDGIRRYTHAVSRHREVLPGQPYIPPPAQAKADPRTLSEEDFTALLLEGGLDAPLDRLLVEKLAGVGPQSAREIIFRAGLDERASIESLGQYDYLRLWQALKELMEEIEAGKNKPVVVFDREGKVRAFAAFRLTQYHGLPSQELDTASQACELFFKEKEAYQHFQEKRRSLTNLLQRELKRCQKKAALQAEAVAEGKEAEKWRLAGELITANIYRLEKGMQKFTAENFYDPSLSEVEIELDPALTPAQNAQNYFRRYNRAHKTAVQAARQLEQTREEINYLEGVIEAVQMAQDIADLNEISQELVEAGYLKPETPDKRVKKERERRSLPLQFTSEDGFTIFVGKNNRQNEWLSLKFSQDHDLWLHAKDVPGSHVLVRTGGREVPARTLEQAASLAAYYSKARGARKVAVDYTLCKYLRKPPGSRPGMVTYTDYRTVYVEPCPPGESKAYD